MEGLQKRCPNSNTMPTMCPSFAMASESTCTNRGIKAWDMEEYPVASPSVLRYFRHYRKRVAKKSFAKIFGLFVWKIYSLQIILKSVRIRFCLKYHSLNVISFFFSNLVIVNVNFPNGSNSGCGDMDLCLANKQLQTKKSGRYYRSLQY